MNIIIEGKVEKQNIEVGDIIVLDDYTYMIQKDPHGYVAKSLDGEGGATGRKESLKALIDSFSDYDVEHYSQKDYDLRLVPKVKN